jgi:hypothetical protein
MHMRIHKSRQQPSPPDVYDLSARRRPGIFPYALNAATAHNNRGIANYLRRDPIDHIRMHQNKRRCAVLRWASRLKKRCKQQQKQELRNSVPHHSVLDASRLATMKQVL